jgi:RNA polymerase sigma factor (TIGR02999 family)
MPTSPDDDVRTTQLLNRLASGDKLAAEQLAPLVYERLRRMAGHQLGQQHHSLQPTELVSEAWIRIARNPELNFDSRAGFFVLASRIMRSVVVDHARARSAEKRGGGRGRITLRDDLAATPEEEVPIADLESALTELEAMDPELCRLVEMRFFAGMKHPAIAEALAVSLRPVARQWLIARAWLKDRLSR